MAVRPLLITNPRLRKRFRDTINKLWRREGAKLFAYIEHNPGPPSRLSRSWRDRQADLLGDLVIASYLPYLRRWVRKRATRLHVRFSARTPRGEKARLVSERLTRRGWGHHKNIVYASFVGRKKCLKVGRSNVGLKRIVSQRRDVSFWHAGRVVLFFPKKRKRKVLPALECALTHLYDPIYTDIWPAQTKYGEKCPACRDTVGLRKLVEELFPT